METEITKIWFDAGRIYGLAADGRTLWQSLLYYPRLLEATGAERARFDIGAFGIRWPELDEDVSFESFDYPDPEPRGISRLLLSLPALNLSALARRMGMQQSLLAAYKNGTKTPSAERAAAIATEIRRIAAEMDHLAQTARL